VAEGTAQVVGLALDRCKAQAGGTDNIHRTKAACGEPLSAHAFFKDHPEAGQPDIDQARVSWALDL
jgi:hypothetical protein